MNMFSEVLGRMMGGVSGCVPNCFSGFGSGCLVWGCGLVVGLVVASCSGKEQNAMQDDSGVLQVVITEIPEAILDASKYVDSVRFVRLEKTPEALVGMVTQVLFTDSLLIVSENRNKSILFFSRSGKYLSKIHRLGRGPEEYLSLTSIMLDVPGKYVTVYDIEGRKLLVYDFQGNCVRSVSNFCQGEVIRNIINLPSGGYLCYRQDYLRSAVKAGLWSVDAQGEMVHQLLVVDSTRTTAFTQAPFSLYPLSGGRMGLADVVSSDVYVYDSEGLHKTISYQLPEARSGAPGISGQRQSPAMLIMHSESDRFAFAEFLSDDLKHGVVVVSKEDGTYEVGQTLFGLSEPRMVVFSGLPVLNNLPGVQTSILPPEMLLGCSKAPQISPEMKERLQQLLGNATDDEIIEMNPVVQLLYLKN